MGKQIKQLWVKSQAYENYVRVLKYFRQLTDKVELSQSLSGRLFLHLIRY